MANFVSPKQLLANWPLACSCDKSDWLKGTNMFFAFFYKIA